MLKEAIQSLLKDRNMMESFMQGRLQLEGVPQMQQLALKNSLVNKEAKDNYSFVPWI
ncbi:hypothetical protein [Paenibacillus marinisediminis]